MKPNRLGITTLLHDVSLNTPTGSHKSFLIQIDAFTAKVLSSRIIYGPF